MAAPVAALVQPRKDKNQRRVVDKPSASFKDACLSAIILALANMGDAFLYAYLPANHLHLGISSFWVGVILSVNRFTRLFLNGRVAWILSNKGIKTVVIIAVLLASLTTASYGWMSAIPLWILARVLWGFSFSTLRLGNILYALGHQQRGLTLGVSRAFIELGPVLALIAGPLLLVYVGSRFTFLSFGVLSIAGLLLVFPLGAMTTESISKKDLNLSFPSSVNILVLLNSFITEGVLVVLVVKLIQHDQSLNLVNPLALVGLLLGYRRLSFILYSPLSGWLADKWGFQKVFTYTAFATLTGLWFMQTGAILTGIIIAFTFSAMNASTAAGAAIRPGNSLVKEVSDHATWRDIGMATGAFAGALLLSLDDMRLLMCMMAILYGIGLLYHSTKAENLS